VLVAEASSKLETIPALYETVTEQKLVQESSRTWRVDLGRGTPPASQDLLDAARAAGIELDSARTGQCFHEHYRPATFEQVAEQVLVAEGHDLVETTAAEYRWVEKQVLVRESSKRLENYDAVHRNAEEQVIDVPAHIIWKKGRGPMQKIDEATGEIMCLVDIPATYKTLSKRILVTPAGTREIEIPSEYKTVRVQELVTAAAEHRHAVEAKYDQVLVTKKTADPLFPWHEIHDTTEPSTTRTGKKICLTEEPAKYATVKRRIVKTPAQTREIEIPAKYETVKVSKLMAEAREQRTEIPAIYKTVTHQELGKDGMMEWRSILCETNMTVTTITDIQRKLKSAGYEPGAIDGVIGAETMDAINRFQRDKSLPVDRYLNIETIRALEISI
jgi:hypothetical protein